jgi:5-methylcytosine-specific restriction endonuclease McrA
MEHFTELQWRELDRVEKLTRGNYLSKDLERKRVYAPHFAGGEFFLAWREDPRAPGFVGPVFMNCFVFEAASEVVLAYTDSRVSALRDARRVFELLPRVRLDKMFAEGRQRVAERRAADEAIAAIAKAKLRPKKISRRARAVFEASDGKCHYCSAVLTIDGRWHIEHKFPRALFGGSEQSNLVAACAPCNHAKRDKTDLEFQAYLAAGQARAA